MSVVVLLILLLTAVILFYVKRLADDVRAILEELPDRIDRRLAGVEKALRQGTFSEGLFRSGWGPTGHHESLPQQFGCFVVWEWQDGDWQAQGLPAGSEGCLPPNYPGAFPGDLAKTWMLLRGK
jgi:hypothetical protein